MKRTSCVAKIESYIYNPIRLSGQNRYGTNAAVLNHFADKFSYDKVYVTSGENYPDALSGSVLAASNNSPLILVGTSVDSSVMSSVKAHRDQYNDVVVLGGTGAVSDSIENILKNGEYVKNNNYILGSYDGTYTGYIVNNIPIGEGSFSSKEPDGVLGQEGSKFTMVGIWTNGHINGQVSIIWDDGYKYRGEYKNGNREGQGTYALANGKKYVGQWKNDKMEGQGTYTWTDGDKYVGQFKNGNREGQGTMTWANGTKYIGQFKNGIPLR